MLSNLGHFYQCVSLRNVFIFNSVELESEIFCLCVSLGQARKNYGAGFKNYPIVLKSGALDS